MPIGDVLLYFLAGLALLAALIVLLKYTLPVLDYPAKHQGNSRRQRRGG